MKLYRIAGLGWTGTQAEARAEAKHHGTAWQPVEVPTDKPGLIAWLNDEGRVIPATEPEILEQVGGQLAEPCNTAAPSNRCAKCHSILIATPEGAEALAHGVMLDRIGTWLDDAPLWALNRLSEIVADKATTTIPAGEKLQ